MPLRHCKLVTPCLQKYPWFPEYPPYIFFICCKVSFSCINKVSWTIPSLLDFLSCMISLYHSYTSFKYTVCIDSLWFPRSVLVVTHKETSLFVYFQWIQICLGHVMGARYSPVIRFVSCNEPCIGVSITWANGGRKRGRFLMNDCKQRYWESWGIETM